MDRQPKCFQILALDGGGIKGIFSAAMLAHIEDDLETSIVDHFDLIVGTSTGGIIALGLGMGLSAKEILEFYIEHGPKIFPNNCFTKCRQLFRNKYSNKELKHALKDCFGEETLGSSCKRLVIPSFNIDENSLHVFKTPHHKNFRRDYKEPIWKVAMATSAAPTYFPVFRDIDHIRLIDGGIWANNPSMVGVVEAVNFLDIPLGSIHVLSLGTTLEVKKRRKSLNYGGVWQWKTDIVDLILDGQSVGAHTQCLHLLGKDKVMRLNPVVPQKLFAIDKLNIDEMKSKAASQSRGTTPHIKEHFMPHKAMDYTPIHTVEGENES